jgi:hypothetical protein
MSRLLVQVPEDKLSENTLNAGDSSLNIGRIAYVLILFLPSGYRDNPVLFFRHIFAGFSTQPGS